MSHTPTHAHNMYIIHARSPIRTLYYYYIIPYTLIPFVFLRYYYYYYYYFNTIQYVYMYICIVRNVRGVYRAVVRFFSGRHYSWRRSRHIGLRIFVVYAAVALNHDYIICILLQYTVYAPDAAPATVYSGERVCISIYHFAKNRWAAPS